jgi:hypothetical protein
MCRSVSGMRSKAYVDYRPFGPSARNQTVDSCRHLDFTAEKTFSYMDCFIVPGKTCYGFPWKQTVYLGRTVDQTTT